MTVPFGLKMVCASCVTAASMNAQRMNFQNLLRSPCTVRRLPSNSLVCKDEKLQGSVDRTLDSRAFRGWIETDNPWTNDDETDNGNSLGMLLWLFRGVVLMLTVI